MIRVIGLLALSVVVIFALVAGLFVLSVMDLVQDSETPARKGTGAAV